MSLQRPLRLHLLVYLALMPLVGAWLYSLDAEIRSATTYLPVRLRCINWYGAHMETFVAGGLDTRSCGEIADSILSIGANCVRIPLSVQLVLHDPRPPASSVAGLNSSECNASTALEVLDCQVRELTRRGLMVILNNHNSQPGWMGSYERVPQGLWHTPVFSTNDWITSLSLLAARYRHDSLVVGIDIRNEIHDQNGTIITWGKTEDVNSDWKAATVLADAAIREVNPEVLVIVSGMSLSFDLRAMQDLHNYRSKYVFTTHVYQSSLWFTNVNWSFVFSLSLFVIAVNLAVVYYVQRKHNVWYLYTDVQKYRTLPYFLAGALLLPVYALVVSIVWIQQTTQVGCSSIAHDATPMLYLGMCGLFVVALAWLFLAKFENVMCWNSLVISLCFWNACLGVVQAGLSMFYQTYWAVQWELRRWESRDIPVWVGEFGTYVGDTSVSWGWVMTYIGGMHYAYWPLNGCRSAPVREDQLFCPVGPAALFMSSKFNKDCIYQQHVPSFHKHWTNSKYFETFENDTFGILDCDWATVRDVNWTKSIFPDAMNHYNTRRFTHV